jgi:drug/metabolite transporter (DMT)-like permease
LAKVVSGELSPVAILLVSELCTIATFSLLSGPLRAAREVRALTPQQRRRGVLAVLLTGVVGHLFWLSGLRWSTATNATLLSSIDVLFTTLLTWILIGQRPHRSQFLALPIVILGAATIILRGFTGSFAPQAGDVLLLFCAASFSLGNSLFHEALRGVHAGSFLIVRSSVSLCCLIPLALILQTPLSELANLSAAIIPSVLAFVLISRVIGTFSHFSALSVFPASSVSLWMTSNLVGSALLATLMLGEMPRWYHLVGGLAIALGTVIYELGELRRASRRGALGTGEVRQ